MNERPDPVEEFSEGFRADLKRILGDKYKDKFREQVRNDPDVPQEAGPEIWDWARNAT